MGLGALLLALALGLPLAGQQPGQESAASFLTGVRPDQIQFDKNYYKQMSRAFDSTPIVTPPSVQKTFNPSSYFLPKIPALPKVSLPSWVPLVGSKAPARPVPVARQQPRRQRGRTVGQ
jgi:hypothetical protein